MSVRSFGLIAFLSLYTLQTAAHDPNKAYFEIEKSGNYWLVTCEFPWSLRNAVIDQFEYLEEEKDPKQFEKAFELYLTQNLVLHDEKGQALKLVQMEEVKSKEHAHSATFELRYEYKKLASIINTCLFNLYPNQTNFHKIHMEGSEMSFETNLEKHEYFLHGVSNKMNYIMVGLLFSVLILLVLGLVRQQF